MTKNELIVLYRNLNSLNLKGTKFNYAIAKNIRLLKPEMELIDEANKFSEDYQKFSEARIDLLKNKFAKKNDKGEIETDERGDAIVEDLDGWKEALKSLEEEHKEAVEARKKQAEEVESLLKEESTLQLHKINIADVPNDITTSQMNSLYEIIEE